MNMAGKQAEIEIFKLNILNVINQTLLTCTIANNICYDPTPKTRIINEY